MRLPTQVLNDKGRSHQRPQVPSLKGMEFRAETVYSRTASANTGILEARLWLGDRDRALLAIASFIIQYPRTKKKTIPICSREPDKQPVARTLLRVDYYRDEYSSP